MVKISKWFSKRGRVRRLIKKIHREMQNPDAGLHSRYIWDNLCKVVEICGSPPLKELKEESVGAYAWLSLIHLLYAEKHPIVKAKDISRIAITGEIVYPDEESWAELASNSIKFAQLAFDSYGQNPPGKLKIFLNEVIQRAANIQDVTMEDARSQGWDLYTVESLRGRYYYVPRGYNRAKIPLSIKGSNVLTFGKLTVRDLQEFAQSFQGYDWLVSWFTRNA